MVRTARNETERRMITFGESLRTQMVRQSAGPSARQPLNDNASAASRACRLMRFVRWRAITVYVRAGLELWFGKPSQHQGRPNLLSKQRRAASATARVARLTLCLRA